MIIEERLKQTLKEVAAAAPGEAGAYDRFLRRRVRRTRRVAAATAFGLAMVLALVAMLAGRPWGDDATRRPALGQAPAAQWRPGPLVAAAPLLGFEIEVPAGWEANRTAQGFELRPVAEDLRRQLPTPIQVDTYVLDPEDHPQGAELFQDNNGFGGDISGTIRTGGARTTGSFPDGRPWLRTDGGTSGRRTTVWYTPWPYRCQGGEPCPDVLSLRTLRVALIGAGDRARAEAMELAPALLRSARPISNAVAGRAHARRPDCVDAVTARPSLSLFASQLQGSSRTVRIVWRFSTSSHLIPCHLRRALELSFLDDGQPVGVDGDGRRVLEGDLPEGMPLAPGELGVEWRWTNWCGGNVQVRIGGAQAGSPTPPPGDLLTPSARPDCVDPTKPSRLRAVEWGE
jgi:hypothetical protein